MNMEERLEAVVSQAEIDGEKWHKIIHGQNTETVKTENGILPTVSKQLKDVREEIINGLTDYSGQCEGFKNESAQIKTDNQTIKNEIISMKTETQSLRNEAETFKNMSQTTYNSISSATSTSIAKVKAEGEKQIEAATQQAELAHNYALNAAPTPLGTKLTIPACSKVPDGYEPVWYKNTITRARYPDFFTQLVDTNSLIFVSEATYNSQVQTYGMCSSYVKVNNDTLILPLLVNFGRGGTVEQLGRVELDQFQGHFHNSQIRLDMYGSGDGYTIGPTSGADEGMRAGAPDLYIREPLNGNNGSVRYGNETRPKGYYELTYIKCADVSRKISMEETSEIRNIIPQKLNTDLSNIASSSFLLLMRKMVPDWKRRAVLALNKDVAITKMGWIIMRNTDYTTTINGYINGYNVFTQVGAYGHWQEWNSFSFLVDNGDKVKLTAGELSFIPCKGN